MNATPQLELPARSMTHWSVASGLDLVQGKREGHGRKRNKRQDPEGVHIGEERGLRPQLLSDPVEGLLMRLGEGAALGGKIARRALHRILVLNARGDRMLDQPALMELLAMGKHVGSWGNAD